MSIFVNLMHKENPYLKPYNFKVLENTNPSLSAYILTNPEGHNTIDFKNPRAVFELNKALLLHDYKLNDYTLPKGYLIAPIPGRLDYLLHIREVYLELFNASCTTTLKGLDIGCGANAIYSILGAQHFKWKMVGADSDLVAIKTAKANATATPALQTNVVFRHQENKSNLFKGIVNTEEAFDFVVCNPPFHKSKDEALKGSLQKFKNLNDKNTVESQETILNFQGQANELWCNGGEALFIKRLIKESIYFKSQIRLFSSLVSKNSTLIAIEKQLKKVSANYKVIAMAQGNKKSRCIVWWF